VRIGPILKAVHSIKIMERITGAIMGKIIRTPREIIIPIRPPLRQPPPIRVCL